MQAGGRYDDESHDESRTEPVVFLPLVQQYLQGANPHRQQGDTDVIQPHPGSFDTAQVRWILDEEEGQQHGARPTGRLIKKIQRQE